jgi:hypothetical protein
LIPFLSRMIIVVVIIVSIQALVEFALIQRYWTILVTIPIIITTIAAIAINIAYWLPKYYPSSGHQRSN